MVQTNGYHKLKEHVRLVNYPMKVISPGEGGTSLYRLYGYYENHRCVEWDQISVSPSRPFSLTNSINSWGPVTLPALVFVFASKKKCVKLPPTASIQEFVEFVNESGWGSDTKIRSYTTHWLFS